MLPLGWVALGGWLPYLLLASLPNTSVTSVSPETQAKIEVSINTVDFVVTKAKENLQMRENSLKTLMKQDVPGKAAKLAKYSKLVGDISLLLSAVSGFAVCFSIAATFILPSELEVIQENFDKVNNKLDGLSTQMNRVKDELKTSIQFNSWLTTYINWEFDIRNGDDMLNDMGKKLRDMTNKGRRLNLLKKYVKYFENQDINGKANKIYEVTARESITTKNLFQLFREKKL